MKRWFTVLLGLGFYLLQSAPTFADDAAWAALRTNAIVLFRHADAPGFGDPENFRLGDCTTQRNLAEPGREQARRIGQRFAEERVSVAQVLHSQWCRTTETAALAFPTARKIPTATFNSFFNDRRDEPSQTAAARALLTGWDGPGALVVVTHQVNITALTGIVPASGEGVVLRSDNGTLTVIGRIQP